MGRSVLLKPRSLRLFLLTGVEATGGVGQIEAPNTGVILTGSAATGQVNNPTVIGDASFTPIGPFGFGTGAVGTVTVAASAVINCYWRVCR
jgi:hypothetical protein